MLFVRQEYISCACVCATRTLTLRIIMVRAMLAVGYRIACMQEIDCAWDLQNLRESLSNCGRAVTLYSENVDAAAFASTLRWAARQSALGVPSVFHFSGHGNPGVLYMETHDARAAPVEVRLCLVCLRATACAGRPCVCVGLPLSLVW